MYWGEGLENANGIYSKHTLGMVSHIYFDWSGTLVKSDNVHRQSRQKGDCKRIYSDVKLMVKYLYYAGYTLGMITNSDKDVSYLTTCLKNYGLLPYFKGAIVVASVFVISSNSAIAEFWSQI